MLKPFGPFQYGLRHSGGNEESQHYADQLALILAEASWTQRRPKFLIQMREQQGVWIFIKDANKVPPAAEKLVEALKAAGIQPQGMAIDGLDEGTVDLMVGLQ